MNIFYCDNIEGDNARLSEEEAIHCSRVLRKREGDEIVIIDGKGLMCKAVLTSVTKKGCEARVGEVLQKDKKRNFHLHIAIAPTKNIDRIEWFLEKATEIGIDEVTLLLCEHSERKNVRLDRLEKIVLSAAKQSLKARLPKINGLMPFSEFVGQSFGDSRKFMGWCEEDEQKLLRDHYQPKQNVCFLIGPEGGFSLQEVEMARSHGFETISFGDSRLRTETAGLVACLSVNFVN
ncbi:MAG: 16S rRNA (uracil(1498)-N(3))-methyltransferase [Saprospiraceae bacterium]|nr:16S rRNA (uracil(1498)-N(3))-methyltransferase [Saprospiraceae bacterium]MCB9322406.1 16S rRNA (uracil(1498)-N(3))-methyltransferase [Lewinellaceae bacterium]